MVPWRRAARNRQHLREPMIDSHDEAFTIREPARRQAPVVFNVPHAGRDYTAEFLGASRLDGLTLRRSEDAYVDGLFAGALGLGAPMLIARFPRAFLDVNREPYELDPRLFDGRLPPFANTRSMRVAGGLGTIPRIVGDGREIYAGKLSTEEGLARIERFYKPYHQALRDLVTRTAREFGLAVLIDCHSMPSAGLIREAGRRPDIVLGDRFGTSCAGALTDRVEQELRREGFHVTRNKPYAGGFITEHYGEPLAGRHALQIEVNRALYMNERTLEPTAGFARLAQSMTAVFAAVIPGIADDLGHSGRLAAE